MTVYIDISQLEKTRAHTGIQRVVKEFLRRAVKSTSIVYQPILFDTKDDFPSVRLLDINEIKHFLENPLYYQFQQKILSDISSLCAIDFPLFFEIDSVWNTTVKRKILYPLVKEKGAKIVNVVYDLTPVLFAQYAYKETIPNFPSYLSAIYNYSDLVFFPSYASKNDFLEYCHDAHSSIVPKTKVIPLGYDHLSTDSSMPLLSDIESLLNKKYILFVGTLEARKNHAEVLKAFELLHQKYNDLHLVFIGKKGWKVDNLMQNIISHTLLNSRFFWLNNINDLTLNQFYKHAFIVTYLSKYEGYGLPLVESLKHGNITITSKNSSLPEVGKDFADYTTDDTPEALADLISYYYEHPRDYEKKKNFIKKHFQPLSWDQFYRSVCQEFI